MQLPVVKIQRFSTHDGPGIRSVVFLKGCPLNCRWCHNPETATAVPYKDCIALSIDEILREVEKDAAFYGDVGGLTLSGGEPLMHGGAIDLIHAAKSRGLNVVVETCGHFDSELLHGLTAADLVLWDIKDTDNVRHIENTGVSNALILENLREFDALGGATLLRSLMVRGVTLDEKHIAAVARLAADLKHCRGVELLACHAYSEGKYRELGMPWRSSVDDVPSLEEMAWATSCLSAEFSPCSPS